MAGIPWDLHPSISGIGVIYPDTSFVDNRDRDEINHILQKFPDTMHGPALQFGLLKKFFTVIEQPGKVH